jgi:predicted transcriptional regulator
MNEKPIPNSRMENLFSTKKKAEATTMDELEEVNIDESFGISAGKVWQCLADHGETNLNDILSCTSLRTDEVCYALGWLGREGKLAAKKQGKIIKFSLK